VGGVKSEAIFISEYKLCPIVRVLNCMHVDPVYVPQD
jgi:hypothetical protein